jgi:hypothetical protein
MEAAKIRQRIVIGVMLLAVLYGLYDLTLGKRAKHASPDEKVRNAELQSFITQTTANIARDVPSAYNVYVASRAERGWGRNPFSGQAGLAGIEKPKDAALFLYTGYVELAGRKVAIINNTECMVGDPLNKEGFFVKMISPSRVVIENRIEDTEFDLSIKE